MASVIYKFVQDPNKRVFKGKVSFTANPSSVHEEFGDWVFVLNYNSLKKNFPTYEVEYTFRWLTDHGFLEKVTGKTEEDWLDWAKEEYEELVESGIEEPIEDESELQDILESLIDEEIQTLYGDEEEVIVDFGKKPVDISPYILKVEKADNLF